MAGEITPEMVALFHQLGELVRAERIFNLAKASYKVISHLTNNCAPELVLLEGYHTRAKEDDKWLFGKNIKLSDREQTALHKILDEGMKNGGNEFMATCVTIAASSTAGPVAGFISGAALKHAGISKQGFPSPDDITEWFGRFMAKPPEGYKSRAHESVKIAQVIIGAVGMGAGIIPYFMYAGAYNAAQNIGSNEQFQQTLAFQIGAIAHQLKVGGTKAAEEYLERQARFMDATVDLTAHPQVKPPQQAEIRQRSEEYLDYLAEQVRKRQPLMGEEKYWLQQVVAQKIITDPRRLLPFIRAGELPPGQDGNLKDERDRNDPQQER